MIERSYPTRTAQPSEDAEACFPPEASRSQTRREGVLMIYSRTPSSTGRFIEMSQEAAEKLDREARAQTARKYYITQFSTATGHGRI